MDPIHKPFISNEAEESYDEDKICDWILDIRDVKKRGDALANLSQIREQVPDLPIWLWQSYGTMTCLLQEIFSIYTMISPPTLKEIQANRVCNALALMQTIASHPQTCKYFWEARIPMLLYPFLRTNNSSKPFEYLRLTSLGVIGAMVKIGNSDVIKFLLSTEIIPICLRVMEHGTELCRTVACFILEKILLDEIGLNYVNETFERFSHVADVLEKVVTYLMEVDSVRLFRHIIRCYARLSENTCAVKALKQCMPESLRNSTFKKYFEEEPNTFEIWRNLLQNVAMSS